MEPIQVTSSTHFNPKDGNFTMYPSIKNQSIIKIGNFYIKTTKRFNWFQKLMHRVLLGWKIEIL